MSHHEEIDENSETEYTAEPKVPEYFTEYTAEPNSTKKKVVKTENLPPECYVG